MAISGLLGKAFVEIRGDLSKLDDDLKEGVQKSEKATDTIAKGSKALGGALTAGLTVPIMAIGAAITTAGFQFDDALKQIRAGTGATGKELQILGEDFRKTWATGEEGAEEVAAALTNVAKRTSLTGEPLQQLTRQYINFAGLLKTDVAPLIMELTGVFNQWGVSTDQQAGKLDHLWKVVQITGVQMGPLMAAVTRFGPLLREMGFSLEEATALLGNMEKSGVSIKGVMAGLSAASLKFAKDNIPVKAGIAATVAEIVRLGAGEKSASLALSTFGKNGLAMRDAILSGALSVDKLMGAIGKSTETINKADDDTDSFAEKLLELKNVAMAAFAPIGIQLVQAFHDLIPVLLPVVQAVGQAAEWFAALPKPVQMAAFAVAGLLAALGPAIVIFGTLIGSISTIITTFGAFTLTTGIVGGAVTSVIAALGGLIPALGAVILAVTAVYQVWKNWDWIAAFFKGAWAKISGMLDAFPSILLPILGPLGAIIAVWRNWTQITNIVAGVYNAVKTWILDKLGPIFTWLQGKLDAVKGWFNGIAEAGGYKKMVATVGTETKKLETNMVQPIKNATDAATTAFQGTALGAKNLTTATGNLTAAQRTALQAQWGLTDGQKKGKTAADEYLESVKELTAALSGDGVQKEARKTMDALAKLGTTTGLTRGETEQIVSTLEAYLTKMRLLGKTTSTEFARVEQAHRNLQKALIDQEYATAQRAILNDIGVAQMEADRKAMDAKIKTADDYAAYQRELANEEGLRLMEQDRKIMEQRKPLFEKIFSGIGGAEFGKDLAGVIMGAFQGGGDVGKSIGGLVGTKIGTNITEKLGGTFGKLIQGKIGGQMGKMLGSTLGSIIPGVGTLLGGMLGDFLGKGLQKVLPKLGKMFKSFGNKLKGMFGGPSEKELAGRKEAGGVRDKLLKGLNKGQRAELGVAIEGAWKGNEKGAATVIALRDAFIRAGLPGDMGVSYANKIWQAEGKGPEAVKKVVGEIKGLLGKNMPQLMFGGLVNAGKGSLAMLHGAEVVAPLDQFKKMLDNAREKRGQDIKQTSIMFQPQFNGTLSTEMKALVRQQLWPMFLEVLKESGTLRGDVKTVLGV